MFTLLRILTLILPATLIFGQPTNLALEKYVHQGLANNYQFIQEQLRLESQQLKVVGAKGQYMPTITFEASYLLAAGGRTIDFPVGDLFNPIHGSLNELTGMPNFPDNLENQNIQLTPNNFHDTKVKLVQPIFNTAIYYNRKAQEALINVQQAKIDAYQAELAKEIKTTYYQYLQSLEALNIIDSTELLLQQIKRFNEALVRNQKATDEIIANVNYEIFKLAGQRAAVQQQSQTAGALFNVLLNRPLDSSIDIERPQDDPYQVVEELATLQQSAKNNRLELTQVEKGIQANQLLTELYENNKLPTVGLQVSAGFEGFGYTFDSNQAIATVGIGVQWTLFQGKQLRNQVQQSQVETAILQTEYQKLEQQLQLQVINSWYAYRASLAQWEAERAALESAKRNFDLTLRKYESDRALLVELLDAKTQYTNARIAVNTARYACLARQIELNWAAGL